MRHAPPPRPARPAVDFTRVIEELGEFADAIQTYKKLYVKADSVEPGLLIELMAMFIDAWQHAESTRLAAAQLGSTRLVGRPPLAPGCSPRPGGAGESQRLLPALEMLPWGAPKVAHFALSTPGDALPEQGPREAARLAHRL